jgi:DNA (cytosine-5)-methyltransferase 1
MGGTRPGFYEFFCGGGMARAGLGAHWNCLFANDIDGAKAASYAANWGGERLHVADVASLTTADLPGRADLAWASFPCQDLSLAGDGAGLRGARSGTFWPVRRLLLALAAEGRAPGVVVLENVCGAISSHGGRDFAAIVRAFVEAEYRVGAVVMDAKWFVPQSRPRLFILAIAPGRNAETLTAPEPDPLWHTQGLVRVARSLPPRMRDMWVWWRLPTPAPKGSRLADIVDDGLDGVRWHTPEMTERLLSLMSPTHRAKVESAGRAGERRIGCVYRRTRLDERGNHVQRAEVRFDEIAGCLRTPAGGSSRQTILIVKGRKIRSRLLAPREAARLMGLPADYVLPANHNEAYHLAGDGVVVPVVRHLAGALLEPLVQLARPKSRSK